MGRCNLVDEQIGARIRERRIALGLGMEAFAASLAVSVSQIIEWEAGLSRIGSDRLMAIIAILDVPAELFFSDSRQDVIN